MKVIAIYSIKGGVGKTAAAVNLAAEAAASGASVLLWDLDPQGASSYYFRVQPKVRGGSARLVRGDSQLVDHLQATEFDNLDMMPADFSYRNLDLQLDDLSRPKQRLRQLLKGLEEYYDYVFLDCPPGITLLSENVFHAADALLVPVVPTTLSLRTLDQLKEFLARGKPQNLQVMPFLAMFEGRKALHQDVAAEFRKTNRGALKTVIPNASVIERMGLEQAPVRKFAPNSDAAVAFSNLWREVKRRIG